MEVVLFYFFIFFSCVRSRRGPPPPPKECFVPSSLPGCHAAFPPPPSWPPSPLILGGAAFAPPTTPTPIPVTFDDHPVGGLTRWRHETTCGILDDFSMNSACTGGFLPAFQVTGPGGRTSAAVVATSDPRTPFSHLRHLDLPTGPQSLAAVNAAVLGALLPDFQLVAFCAALCPLRRAPCIT